MTHKIYSVTDYDATFVYTTFGWAINGLKDYILDSEVKLYSYNDMKERKIERDSDNNVIFIFEIGNPQHAKLSTKDLRQWYPNAKFVALCSDTIYYMVNNRGWQMDPDGIDLHLECMPQCVEWFRQHRINSDVFLWTLSEDLLVDAIMYNCKLNFEKEKEFDFIGVYGPWTISNPECWRHHAVKYIENAGLKFTQGGGTGHKDDDLDRLFLHYKKSRFTLGTTSHNRPELTKLGCMKGFRDWLGPACGNVLIYDNHDNINTLYNNGQDLIPTYDYDNLDSIVQLAKKLSDKKLYQQYYKKQENWIWDNTLEKQFIRHFIKQGWLKPEDIKKQDAPF